MLYRSPGLVEGALWHDEASCSLTHAPILFPSATTPPDSPYIKLVHQSDSTSAVWSIGSNAFCKVSYIIEGTTPEAVTLSFVRDQQPSFETPIVLYRAPDYHKRSYLFLRRIPGRTLDDAWPSLNQFWRRHYVNAVVNICKEMAEWKSVEFGGVDGQNIPECYLIKGVPQSSRAFSPAILKNRCEALGMDCWNLVFNHADLGPTNIIVENEPCSGKVGIIDFEIAGLLPHAWIRTKFRLSVEMDLSSSVTNDYAWWRREVQNALGASGFDEVRAAWEKWSGFQLRQA